MLHRIFTKHYKTVIHFPIKYKKQEIGLMDNYKSKLRTKKNNLADKTTDPLPSSSKDDPPIEESKISALERFKAPKRKHLTIEYVKDKPKDPLPPELSIKNDSNIKSENFSIKIKTEPIDDEEFHVRDIKKEDNLVIKQEKLEPEETYQLPKIEGLEELKNEIKEEFNIDNFVPPFWEEALNNMREMRKNQDAPVDSMGCDKCVDDKASEKTMRYHVLISLMLSPQTKDQVTYAAMEKLRSHGLTVENILNTSEEVFGKLIYPVGFWKTKAKNIKKATEILQNEYNGDIPKTIKDLLKLPGVGPKIAHLCMNSAWNEVTGIGVDTHVHRISNRLGWVNPQTKTPEDTRKALEKWLPKELWREVNHLMVGFGQTICRPVGPQCANCLNIEICPFAKINAGVKNKKLKKMK